MSNPPSPLTPQPATPPFRAVLIANRGEIAVRIIAACQEMGIRAIAVYSDADRHAAHVRAADAAYRIGPAPALQSYLDSAAIIAAAHAAGADAIHPGYGFLSENAAFADACAAAGLIFIGPPAPAIRLMGSKTAAKRAIIAAGVPTAPSYMGAATDLPALRREAARIGYPLLLKAAAGGGGKGMREVHAPAQLADALAAAQREALAAFGDDAVFLEKLIVAPRHIEFQILADQYGACVHLGERDCSIQRRHQKILEESPSPALTADLRAAMGQAAVEAARAAGYVNAGTCEFLLDPDGSYYFLEMNTRLQVEHPITELVTGLDLVRLQLRIAAGEPLPFTQNDIARNSPPRGHAIEARIYAEDPAAGYLPSTGRLTTFILPRAPGVRADSGVASGDDVSMQYDPMLAKLIVHAPDRAAAVQRLAWAIERSAALGVTTNLPLLRAIAAEPDFRAGHITTAYLDQHDFSAQLQPTTLPAEALLAAALWETLAPASTAPSAASNHPSPFNPWTTPANTSQPGSRAPRRYRYTTAAGVTHTILLTPLTADDSDTPYYSATIDDQPYTPTDGTDPQSTGSIPISAALSADNALTLAIGHRRERAYLARNGYDLHLSWHSLNYTLAKPRPLDIERAASLSAEATTNSGRSRLLAPMAGSLLKVLVAEGDTVSARQTLIVIGAMKMEHAITAPYAGRIIRVPHREGAVVPGGALLIELDAATP